MEEKELDLLLKSALRPDCVPPDITAEIGKAWEERLAEKREKPDGEE